MVAQHPLRINVTSLNFRRPNPSEYLIFNVIGGLLFVSQAHSFEVMPDTSCSSTHVAYPIAKSIYSFQWLTGNLKQHLCILTSVV